MLDFNDYEFYSQKHRLLSAYDPTYPLFNLAGEVGELLSLEAKAVRDGMKDDHAVNVKKELGDILWMITAIAQDYDLTLQEVAQANIDKLNDRAARNKLQGSGDNR